MKPSKPSNILKTIDNENDIAKLLLLGNQAKENDIKANGRVPFTPDDGVRELLSYAPRTGLEFPKAILITSAEVTIKPQDDKKSCVWLRRLEN